MLGSLFDFAKDMGKKLFTTDAEAAMNILKHIEANNPGVNALNVTFDDGEVNLSGFASSQASKEKAVLMAGNVEGVVKVTADALEVDAGVRGSDGGAGSVQPVGGAAAAEATGGSLVQFYTIQKGDTLYAVAKEFYGNGMKYPEIFEANKEVIEDPDKIYPGQKIRIPPLA